MKLRNGFVSNSSSSSFIINFDKDILSAEDIPVKKVDSEKGLNENEIRRLLFGMLWDGYAQTLDDWLESTFKKYKPSLSNQPWKNKVTIDAMLEYMKNHSYPYMSKELNQIKNWGNNDNTYVFEVGTDSDMVQNYYYSSGSDLSELSCDARIYADDFKKHFDKIIEIGD